PGLGGQARLLGGFPLRMLTGFALRREACLLGFSSLACRPRGGVALGLFAGLLFGFSGEALGARHMLGLLQHRALGLALRGGLANALLA
ncbi:hypothetical protein ABTD78_21100, partial [Acinetobacter baumannii]